MCRSVLLLVTLACALMSLVCTAEARRRLSFRVPSVGSHSSGPAVPVVIKVKPGDTSVVLVRTLPNLPNLSVDNLGNWDLGYKFGWFSGEWVGYFKNRTAYVELNQSVVEEELLPLLGMTSADKPKRPQEKQKAGEGTWSGSPVLALVLVGIACLLVVILVFRRSLFAPKGACEDESTEWVVDAPSRVSVPAPRHSPALAMVAPAGGSGLRRPAQAAAFGKRR